MARRTYLQGVLSWLRRPGRRWAFKMNYPLWNLFLTMLWLFIWIVLIVLVIWAIPSIIRSHDPSGCTPTAASRSRSRCCLR